MRKTILAATVIVVLALVALLGFRSLRWQLIHGSTYNEGRISIKLDRHWLVRPDDRGWNEIQRPTNFSTLPLSLNSMLIYQAQECASKDLEAIYKERLYNLSVPHGRAPDVIFHLTSSPEVIDCAQLTSSEGIMDCFFPKDGIFVRIIASGVPKEEALTMVKSMRITKPCTPHAS